MVDHREYTIRSMTFSEAAFAIDWASREGWNPGLHDRDCFYRADPDGFLIGLVDNTPAGAISAVRYGSAFGFIGLYIVLPQYRGTAIGFRLGRAALKRLRRMTIGLDGVLERKENYRQLGFTFVYSNMRFEGTTGGERSVHKGIQELSSIPFHELAAYDRNHFPAERNEFLECWIQQPGSKALGIRENECLAGYGVIRSCRSGYKVGPLLANRPELAEELFRALVTSVPEGLPVYLDIPEPNRAAMELVKHYGMKVVFKTARMYMGGVPALPVERIFGVTSFELG